MLGEHLHLSDHAHFGPVVQDVVDIIRGGGTATA